jgi:hypothetical protein
MTSWVVGSKNKLYTGIRPSLKYLKYCIKNKIHPIKSKVGGFPIEFLKRVDLLEKRILFFSFNGVFYQVR